MKRDVLYIDGIIAVREVDLLGDKILKMCEGSLDDAIRLLRESGFGALDVSLDLAEGFENLILAEERAIDTFILEHAPDDTTLAFLLTPRDYHNAKALVKAKALNSSAEDMLAPQGLIPIDELKASINTGVCPDTMPKQLAKAVTDALAIVEEGANGMRIGALFEKALYAHLKSIVKFQRTLKKLLVEKIDMTNVLCVLRMGDFSLAKDYLIEGGKLKGDELKLLLSEDEKERLTFIESSPYKQFMSIAYTAYEAKLPQTQAERIVALLELTEYHSRQYDLKGTEPFLYYVLRRRMEVCNVRVILVCLSAGMDGDAIKRRLRYIE